MTDYNPILATETDPDAPLRSSLFKRMVANPIALAEGAPGAPKVVGQALDVILPFKSAVLATPEINWTTGLDRATWLEFDIEAFNQPATTGTLRARISNNNGASWAAFTNIATGIPNASSEAFRVYVNLQTGEARAVRSSNGQIVSATISLPGGSPNAIEFELTANTGTSAIRGIGKILGGLA